MCMCACFRASCLAVQRSLEEVKRKREERELKECTFKPAIKPYKGSRRRRAATREQRLEELSKSQKRKYDEREKLRAQRQQEAVKECTFAPKINPQSRVVARGRRGGDVGVRLHQQAQQRARQRAQLKEEVRVCLCPCLCVCLCLCGGLPVARG